MIKVAVCVSGQIREGWQKNIARLQQAFPYDFFYGVWDDQEGIIPDAFSFEEPKMHYHPGYQFTCKTPASFEKYVKSGKSKNEIFLHRTKQILIHAMLVDKLDPSYNMIIRARFDTIIDEHRDVSSILRSSFKDKTPVGFYIRKNNINKETLSKLQLVEPGHERTNYHMVDHLMFHRRDQFNTSMVYDMHEKRRLLPAEWGWYQVLSEPNGGHVTYNGFASVLRGEKVSS